MKWIKLLDKDDRFKRKTFSRAILMAIEDDVLTRKFRDEAKRKLMHKLGMPERYPQVSGVSDSEPVNE